MIVKIQFYKVPWSNKVYAQVNDESINVDHSKVGTPILVEVPVSTCVCCGQEIKQ